MGWFSKISRRSGLSPAAATDRKARLQEAAEGRGVRLRVIVDCAFEALMTEKEQASLAFQVGGRGGC